MREDIKEMISGNKFCVLATVGSGKPHCSLMSYAADENCLDIYMASLTRTKKYLNVMANPAVSLLIDTRKEGFHGQKGGVRALTVTGVMVTDIDEQRKNQSGSCC
jgi:nitroimidazol reductase NimA-like FMN-containing flavoprotein (pyridoxamine 5'-phosphate oxidase superfamily)